MLLRLSYLALTNVFAFVRLLPMSDVDKDVEILALRHQLAVLQRQIDKPHLTASDRGFLGALLHRLPRPTLRQLHLIISPDTILRWHRDLLRRRHAKASRPKRTGRPPTVRTIKSLVLRFAEETDHQSDDLLVQTALLTTGARIHPPAGDQLPVPTQQRQRRDQEDRPPLPRQQLRQRSQHHPIRGRISRSRHLAMEHRHLVPKDRDL